MKSHQFWLNIAGTVIKENGNLFSEEVIEKLSHKLICPILVSVFDEVLKLSPNSPAMYIPGVNLSTEWINGFFDYFLSKKENDIILWEVRDMTEITNNKLIRLQPKMEEKLKNETAIFLNSESSCDTNTNKIDE